MAIRARLGWVGAGRGSGQTRSLLAGSAMTSQAWKGWEQVRGSCTRFAAGGEWVSLRAQPSAAGLGGHADAASLLSPDITVICPWEAFSHLELHELAQYGII